MEGQFQNLVISLEQNVKEKAWPVSFICCIYFEGTAMFCTTVLYFLTVHLPLFRVWVQQDASNSGWALNWVCKQNVNLTASGRLDQFKDNSPKELHSKYMLALLLCFVLKVIMRLWPKQIQHTGKNSLKVCKQ